MEQVAGFLYALVVCAFGGMTGQAVFQFFRPRLGLIWSGGIAAMVAFLLMVLIAALSQWLFGYPALS